MLRGLQLHKDGPVSTNLKISQNILPAKFREIDFILRQKKRKNCEISQNVVFKSAKVCSMANSEPFSDLNFKPSLRLQFRNSTIRIKKNKSIPLALNSTWSFTSPWLILILVGQRLNLGKTRPSGINLTVFFIPMQQGEDFKKNYFSGCGPWPL